MGFDWKQEYWKLMDENVRLKAELEQSHKDYSEMQRAKMYFENKVMTLATSLENFLKNPFQI